MRFIKACFWIGAVVDLLASVPLLFPEVAKLMFGLPNLVVGEDYLYVSRIGAALMLGWTGLLVWGSQKPIERKAVLLLTVVPVLLGLFAASVAVVQSGLIAVIYMAPLWVFYALLGPAYLIAYFMAGQLERPAGQKL